VTRPIIPFSSLTSTTQDVRDEVTSGWQALLESGAFIGGAAVERFECRWAAYCGREHAVGVANGTDALQLCLRALGIGRGDEVLVPANTFIATAEAVVLAGASPVFVDVDPRTLLVTAELIEQAVTARTSAVIPVHLYGHVADVAGIARVASRHGLAVVEDAAQAHGARRDGVPAGATGVAAGYSFYPGKNLGAFGDAGAVVTDDGDLAASVRSLANHGRSEDDRYRHPHLGTNSRLDAMQAVVLDAKLSRLDEWTGRRHDVVACYRERLALVDGIGLVEPDRGVYSAWHLLVARVADRDRVREELTALGVQTGIHYPVPCPQQPAFAQWSTADYPVATAAAEQILSLPLHPHMSDEEVHRVCDAMEQVLMSRRASLSA
jgi:dTDP-4-amino-4,6-dideoxygalactose transaminase